MSAQNKKRKGEASPSTPPEAKKKRLPPKKKPKMLTYTVNNQPDVSIQILDDQTYLDLVEKLCGEVKVGDNEGAEDHMWYVIDVTGQKYEGCFSMIVLHFFHFSLLFSFSFSFSFLFLHLLPSHSKTHNPTGPWDDLSDSDNKLANKVPIGKTIGGQLKGQDITLVYDYGSTSRVSLTLKSIDPMPDNTEPSFFPRRVPKPAASSPLLVLTYERIEKRKRDNVSVQLLTTHNYFDLVDIICRESVVGSNEEVYAHLWNLTDSSGNKYEGPWDYVTDGESKNAKKTLLGSTIAGQKVGESLTLTYDYGTTSIIKLVLRSVELPDGTENSSFPRKK